MPNNPHIHDLQHIYQHALNAVNGRLQVARYCQAQDLPQPLAVIAIGKAASEMAAGAFDVLGNAIQHALVITKHGHLRAELMPDWVQTIEAGHPVPDQHSLIAGDTLLDFIQHLPPDFAVLSLISGGASAVVEVLAPGLCLEALQRVNQWLLQSGLDIHAMNRIRKSLSAIKGGRLAQYLYPRPVYNLLISDVPGDDLQAIGSGLLIPHKHTLLPSDLPDWLQNDLQKQLPLTPQENYTNIVQNLLTSPATARQAAAAAARELGYPVQVHERLLTGDALQTAVELAQYLRTATAGIHLWSSETTMQLPPNPGEGGRCQSLALAAAIQFAHWPVDAPEVTLLAAGTDGNDGPGELAGAWVDGHSEAAGQALGLSAKAYLQAADAGRYLRAIGTALITGPTGTNVMDVIIAHVANH